MLKSLAPIIGIGWVLTGTIALADSPRSPSGPRLWLRRPIAALRLARFDRKIPGLADHAAALQQQYSAARSRTTALSETSANLVNRISLQAFANTSAAIDVARMSELRLAGTWLEAQQKLDRAVGTRAQLLDHRPRTHSLLRAARIAGATLAGTFLLSTAAFFGSVAVHSTTASMIPMAAFQEASEDSSRVDGIAEKVALASLGGMALSGGGALAAVRIEKRAEDRLHRPSQKR